MDEERWIEYEDYDGTHFEYPDTIPIWRLNTLSKAKYLDIESRARRNNNLACVEIRVCPICKGKLVIKTNRKIDKRFLGCINYPHCRFTCSID